MGVGHPCTHCPSTLLLLEALGKGRRIRSPLGFLGGNSTFGKILLWKVVGPGCYGGALGTATPFAHCHHVLFLSQVSDKGLYSCKVNNVAGEAVRTFVLTIQGKLGNTL